MWLVVEVKDWANYILDEFDTQKEAEIFQSKVSPDYDTEIKVVFDSDWPNGYAY